MRTPFSIRPAAFAAGLLLSFPALVCGNDPTLTPALDFTTGLAGQQARVSWAAETGVQYRIRKSGSLDPETWVDRALVTASSTDASWLDPEPAGSRDFYQMPAPEAEVYSVYPPVLSPAGGVITVEGQCLPPGSELVFEIEGQPPLVLALTPAGAGLYRALLPAGGVVPGGNVLSAAVRRPGEIVLLDIRENFAITATGRANDGPPVLPPALAWVETVWNKQCVEKDTTVRLCDQGYAPTGDCDDSDPNRSPFHSLLMPALMKAKEKANRTKCSNNLRQFILKKEEGGRHTPFHNKYRPQFYAGSLPGEVAVEQDDLCLETPAGPPIIWTRTYRNKGDMTTDGGGWTSCYNIRIEPVPLAAGVNATRLYLYGGDGRRDILHRQANGTYTCTGMFREGRFNPDTSFTLTFADKSQFIFCQLVGAPWSGRIGRIADANGVGLNFTYTGASQLHTVTSQFGQSITCAYGPTGALSSITDHTGRFVSYDHFAAGQPGGNPGNLRSVSCPQVAGQAPVAGPTTFTYTTGHADDRLNHNLLTAHDGAGQLLAAYTYSSTTDPLAIDFDTCATAALHRISASSIEFATIKIEIGAAGQKMLVNNELGCLTECDFDLMHRCVAVREYTGFSTPGVPVTSTTNRPDPAKKRRPGDPDFYQTTFRYNADSCVTRITHPDRSQDRFTYGRELRKDCPVRERGNAHVVTTRTPGGEERSVYLDHLAGFGTERRWRTGGGLILHETAGVTRQAGGSGGGSVWDGGDGNGGCTDLISFSFSQVKYNYIPQKADGRGSGGGSVWDGGDGDGGCTDLNTRTYTGGRFILDIDGAAAGGVKPVFGLKTEWITSIGLPKITPKIAKESHGKFSQGSGGNPIRLVTSHGQIFTWRYDTRGNCTGSRTPVAGSGTDCTYNSLGQCTSVTVLNGAASSFRDECVYDAATSFLSSVICDKQPDGTGLQITTSFARNSLGLVTSTTDPRGFVWQCTYNPADQITRTQTPVVGTNAATASTISTDYFYDFAGYCRRADRAHRDATGALVAANPACSTFFVYDHGYLVRVAAEERPVGPPVVPPVLDPELSGIENFAVCDYGYDAAGQCIQLKTPAACRAQNKDAVCDFQYDECGLLYRGTSGGLGALTSTTVQRDYDALGAVVRVAFVSSVPGVNAPAVTCTWDGFHRLSSETDEMGNVTTYEYDNQGFTNVSIFGEVNDVPGSAGNVLLAKGRGATQSYTAMGNYSDGTSHFTATCTLTDGIASDVTDDVTRGAAGRRITNAGSGCMPSVKRLVPAIQKIRAAKPHSRMAFFDVFVADDEWTWERFPAGAPAPHPTETTTVHYSPAGLVQTVICNGDTLMTVTHDTAGRAQSSHDGTYTYSITRNPAGMITSSTRTDHSMVAGTPGKTYTVTLIVDPLGRTVSCTDGGGNNRNWDFDSHGRIVSATQPNGLVVRCAYDGSNAAGAYSSLVTADVNGDGTPEILSSNLCRSGECRSVTNSNGYVTTFSRDTQRRVERCDWPDNTFETVSFDQFGRATGHQRRNGTVIACNFDYRGAVTSIVHSNVPAPAITVAPTLYTYDGLGQPRSCTQGESHLEWTYDSLGNELSETHNGRTVSRKFDHRGRNEVAYGGARFAEARHPTGLLLSVSALNAAGVPISPPVSVMQYAGRRLAEEARANGTVTTYQYRGDGDPPLPGPGEDFSFDACVSRGIVTPHVQGGTNITATCSIRRDRNQQVTRDDTAFSGAQASAGRSKAFTLDSLGRVTNCITRVRQVTDGPVTTESDVRYTYDLEGRRLTATGGVNPGPYTQNPAIPPGDHQASQYTTWAGGHPLIWDDNGCLTSFSSSTAQFDLVYDSNSRLVAVNNPATGAAIATYAYNGEGRRTRSSVGGDPVTPPVTTYFVYDDDMVVQELGEDGLANFTFANGAVGGLCIISRNGTLVYPHGGGTASERTKAYNGHVTTLKAIARWGNGPHLITNTTGDVIEYLDCDDACRPIFLTSDGIVRPGATSTLSGLRWLAPGCAWCPETGLFQCSGGVYSPALGQPVSLQKDKPKNESKPDRAMWDLAKSKKV